MTSPTTPTRSAPDVGVVVVAAGSGSRLGADRPKALVEVGGRTLLAHALDTVARVERVAAVVVVGPDAHVERLRRRYAGAGVEVVAGGTERADSVAAGLAALPTTIRIVVVHDAARALAPPTLFDAVIDEVLQGADGAVPALPVVDTIKVVDGQSWVLDTPTRATLRVAQTPQAFEREVLVRAHRAAGGQDRPATDDATLVEAVGGRVRAVPGDADALKITHPADLSAAERIVARRAEALTGSAP